MPKSIGKSETEIWARIIQPERNGLSAEAAHSLLQMTFSPEDLARMNELAEKSRDGLLTRKEGHELEHYVRVGDALSLIHLKARKSLKS